MGLKNYIIYFEVLTAIITIIFYKRYLYSFYKYFLLYVCTIVIVEFLAYAIFDKSSYQLYNVYTFLEYNLVALIYYKLTKDRISHKWIKYLMLLFNSVYFLSFIFIVLQKYTVLLGAITVSVFMIFYLKELLNSEKIIDYRRNLSFWITVAFLLYYLTTIPFYLALYIVEIKSRMEGVMLFNLQNVITIITHLCFIYGLLWSRKKAN